MNNRKYKFQYAAAVLVLVLLAGSGCSPPGPGPAGTTGTTGPSGTSAAVPAVSGPGKSLKIITFGDSITRGEREGVRAFQTYTYYLGEIFKRNGIGVRMIREGISGEDTRGAVRRLERDVISRKPDYVTIMYGTNDGFIDVWEDETATAPRVPLGQYEKNLREMVRKLRAGHIEPVLMTPIPMGNFYLSDVGIYRRSGRNFLLKEYAAAVRRIASEERVPLVDHFRCWLERGQAGQDIGAWLTDGMHPNPKGHRFMAAAIFRVLKNGLTGD